MSQLLPDDLPDGAQVTSVGRVAAELAAGPVLTVCFDLDGCLVDSRAAIATSINDALHDHGLPVLPVEKLHPYIGPPLRPSLAVLIDELLGDPDDVDELLATYRRHYAHTSLRLTTRIPGIREALDAFAPWARAGVVTSKPTAFAVPIVDAVGLRRHLLFVEGPDLEATAEAKSETLARVLDRWGRGDATVMIGDRSHDIAAGVANDALTVGVTWGIGDRAELVAAGADHIVDDPAQLPGLLHEIRAGVDRLGGDRTPG